MPPLTEDHPTTGSSNREDKEMIAFADVSKSWGDNHVLRSLNFHVAQGEKVSIIGPSGSGKTTILRILMTLETPDDGLVSIEGETLWDARGKAKPKETERDAADAPQGGNGVPVVQPVPRT